MSERPVRVRMAPSPTGHLHVGTAKASLFNWMFARHYGGTFILRLEDTDVERSQDEYAREIVQGLQWLGIDWDEGPYLAPDGVWTSRGDFGPYKQSERTSHYRAALEKLLAEKKAYWCYCTKEELELERTAQQAEGISPKYSGKCRDLSEAPDGKTPQVIRLKVPEKTISFNDLVRGEITTDLTLIGDQAIARSLDSALYNFAVVVDDIAMEISHVVRGEDHISNTPKQLVVFEALGSDAPEYLHFSLNLDSDRKKLSKRNTEVSLLAYRDQGFLPAALTNFFALLGWHPAGDEEVFTLQELGNEFSIERVQKSGAVFDETKLRWLNREHIKRLPVESLAQLVQPFLPADAAVEIDVLERYVHAEKGRADTLVELAGEATWLVAYNAPKSDDLIPKDGSKDDSLAVLTQLHESLEALEGEAWIQEVESELNNQAEAKGKRTVFWPVRVALSGQQKSPDPITLMQVLGIEVTKVRIEAAIAALQ